MKAKTKTKSKFEIINSSKTPRIAKNTVLTIIILVMLTVLFYTIFTIIATPEFLVKREIESITADYYENYFYKNNILSPNSLSESDVKEPASAETHLASILENYLKTGFSRITLNQLLLSNNREHYASASYLARYCDLNSTIIHIFPEPPYTSKNYRVKYNYSCNF